MSVVGVIALVIIFALLVLTLYCVVAINRPTTKKEVMARFKQDCEDFDEYMEEKHKK